LGGTVLAAAIPPLAPVILTIGAAIGGLWGLSMGWQRAGLTELKQAQKVLEQNLMGLIEPVRRMFFSEPDTSFRSSLVAEYFGGLARAMDEQIQTIVQRKLGDAEAEHARLDEAGDLNDEQRRDGIERAKGQLAEWEAIGRSIASASERLNDLKRSALATHERQDVPT